MYFGTGSNKAKNSFLSGISISTSATLMLVGAILAREGTTVVGILFFILGTMIGIAGFTMLLHFFGKNGSSKKVSDFFISLAILLLGILVAVFSNEFAVIGLIVIGGLFITLGIFDIITFVKSKRSIDLALGIMRILVGVLLAVGGLNIIDKDTVIRSFGFTMIVLGAVFLALDTFK